MQNQDFKKAPNLYRTAPHDEYYQLPNVNKKSPKLRNKFVLQSPMSTDVKSEECCTQTSETILQLTDSGSKDSLSTPSSASLRQRQVDFCLKNRSLTEQFLRKPKYHPKFLEQTVRPSNSHESRFTQTQSIEGRFNHPNFIETHDSGESDYEQQNEEQYGLQANFMSPTVSSEQKNHSKEFQLANKLLPKIYRGRSLSPQLCQSDRNTRRIPYIDQSITNVSSIVTLVNVKREPNRLQNYKDPDEHEQDLLKINFQTSVENAAESSDRTTVSTDSVTPTLILKLKNKDWNTSLKAMAELIEICRINGPSFISPHMAGVYQKIIELLKSPRTYVCRTACQAAGHLFEYVKDTRKPEFDEIVNLLLYKTADANRFLRYDANLALDCMVTHIPIISAVRGLCNKGPLHKNPLVRSATARLLICSILITGPAVLLNSNTNETIRQRIFITLGKFLDDKNLETRKYAERLYKILCRESSFDFYLKRYLNNEQINKIKTTLKLVRKTPK